MALPLSCGSGTFLVAAAARKSVLLQRLVAAGEVEADYALGLLTDTFLGKEPANTTMMEIINAKRGQGNKEELF